MFFLYVRTIGHKISHPTEIYFKHRICNYILGKHSAAILSEKQETEDREETCLTSSTAGTFQKTESFKREQ